jgi:hypothetical protein
MTDYSVLEPAQAAGKEDVLSLRQVLGDPIMSSAEYLKKLFEIDERAETKQSTDEELPFHLSGMA